MMQTGWGVLPRFACTRVLRADFIADRGKRARDEAAEEGLQQ
jgi:hypothetical protein